MLPSGKRRRTVTGREDRESDFWSRLSLGFNSGDTGMPTTPYVIKLHTYSLHTQGISLFQESNIKHKALENMKKNYT